MAFRIPLRDVSDVAATRLCSGCGACAYMEPDRIEMVDTFDFGRRPRVRAPADSPEPEGLAVCPGRELRHDFARTPDHIEELLSGWGPVMGVWEGHASDDALRFAGSSGGVISSLALHCIEVGGMHGALHTVQRDGTPFLNQTTLSRTRDELLAGTGSRYSPASPCDGLQQIADAPGPCVFIGKPCDVAATRSAAALRPALAERLGVTIALFCAGTPTTRGTFALLHAMGIEDPHTLTSLRFRGNGWPGNATGTFEDEEGRKDTQELTYAQSWGAVLSNHQLFRCNICADHSGEFADIAVGDPWYREIEEGEPGSSLLVARTRRGREIIEAAIESGHLVAHPVAPEILPASQPNLLRARGQVWGRSQVLRAFGLPAPRLHGIATFRYWWGTLRFLEKIQTLYGTIKRVFTKRLRTPAPVIPWTGDEAKTTDVEDRARRAM